MMSDQASPDPIRVPSGTTTRFALLIVVVAATAAAVFFNTFSYALPDEAQRVLQGTRICQTQSQTALAELGPISADDERFSELNRRLGLCHMRAYREQAIWVGIGLLILFASAVASYLLHPKWIIRRRGLRPLSADHSPALLSYLDGVSREMRLARAPDWLIAPYAATAGGQAFGLPWRRCVQLDAGLLVRYTTDRPAFRAVVLHELAHLRNRDVDKTYLAIGIWHAFVIAALAPFLIFTFHPQLLRDPWRWRWHDITFVREPGHTASLLLSLLVLTGLVYATRNAILRVRESHADVVAAAHDGSTSALPAVLERLLQPSLPRWVLWWSRHPSPSQRLAAVADPDLLLRGGYWEVAEVGIVGGIICTNLGFILGPAFPDGATGRALVGLLVGPPMIGMLALAVWRATIAETGGHVRRWLVPPIIMAGGYVIGSSLSVVGSTTAALAEWTRAGYANTAFQVSLLLVGAILTAVSASSCARGVVTAPRRLRWVMPTIILAEALAAAVWFTEWFVFSILEPDQGTASPVKIVFGAFVPGPPAVGGDIDWYRTLAAWVTSEFVWFPRIYDNFLTLPSLTLLWLIPVAATIPAGRLRLALTAGLLGGLAAVVTGVALPFVTQIALPTPVRHDPDVGLAGIPSFTQILFGTYVTVTALIQAVIAATVVVKARRHRPALTLLAISITAAVGTGVYAWVLSPISCRLNLATATPSPSCRPSMDIDWLSETMHRITLRGLALSVLAAVLATALASLRRRAPIITSPDKLPSIAAPWRRHQPLIVSGLVVLVLVNLAAAGPSLARALDPWPGSLVPGDARTADAGPRPTPSPPAGTLRDNGIRSLPAKEILARAVAATTSAASYRIRCDIAGDGGKLKADLLVSGAEVVGTMDTGGRTYQIMHVNGAVYLNMDEANWRKFGLNATHASLFQGKWVTSKGFSGYAKIFRVDSLLGPRDGAPLTKGDIVTIENVQAITLLYADGGRAYVATTGEPYLLRLVDGSGYVQFTDFGAGVGITVPPAYETIDMDELAAG